MGARGWDHTQGSLFPWKPALSKGAWGLEAPWHRESSPASDANMEKRSSRAHLGKVFVKAAALAPSPHGVAGAGRRVGCIGAHQLGQVVGARTCRRSSRERLREGWRRQKQQRGAARPACWGEGSPLCQFLPLLRHWASAGSSESEQPEPLRAERCWSRQKACGPSAAQAARSARCWC